MQNESDQPPDSHAADWDAIARWLDGASDSAEASAVEAWVASHPLDAQFVARVNAHADRAAASAHVDVNVDDALARVHARMAAETPKLTVIRGGAPRVASKTAPTTQPASANRWLGWRGAALATAAGLALYIGSSRWSGAGAAAVAAQDFVTKVGQRDSLTLSDGTRVVLAPGSRLTVAAGYGAKRRDVTLDGAAFFAVQHDAASPFTVRANGAEINDIGTAFTVRTDAGGGVSVAVTHGIVAMRDSTAGAPPSVELRAGDRGALRNGAVTVSRGTVTADDVAWTRGRLAYRDTPLTEVQADLARWYGLDLRLVDSLLIGRTLTGASPSDSAAATVQWIALMLGAEVKQRGDTVFLQLTGRGVTP